MLEIPEIGCVGVSFRTADVELRGRLTFTEELARQLLGRLAEAGLQGVVLCTCCRTELYYCGPGLETAKELLSQFSGVPAGELLAHLNIYRGRRALRHLFPVAGGMTSMVLGEDEILRQTKGAYALAAEQGTVGYELNRCFQDALACGKRIRSETFISQIPLSTATIAANAASAWNGRGEPVRVLVIGASGTIGQRVVKDLLGHKNVTVTVTSRRHGEDISFGERVRPVDYEDRYRELDRCHCVISATASPHHTVTAHELRARGIKGKRLFIDLAVPADMDAQLRGYEGSTLLDMDDIGRLAESNAQARQDKAQAAQALIDQETDRLEKELMFHWSAPLLEGVRAMLKTDPDRALFALKKDLDAQSFRAVMDILTEL